MNNTLHGVWAVSALVLLTACGGGSAVTSDITPQKAPTKPAKSTASAPVSPTTVDLLAFAKGGTTSTLRNDVLRIRRTSNDTTVAYDTVDGSNMGLLTYRDADGNVSYRVTAAARPDIVVGSGSYTGPMEMTYSTTAKGALKTAAGDLNMAIDFKAGTVETNGLVANADNNIQMLGEGHITKGQIQDNNTTIRLRDSQGTFIRDYAGSTVGILTNGAKGRDAVVGTVESSGLRMNGGFFVNENLKQ